MMKNFMKAPFIIVTVLAAFFFISCGSSAGEPQTQQEPEQAVTPEPSYHYKLAVIGGPDSVYRGYVVHQNKDGDVAMYGAYVKGLAKEINDSITDDKTRNYLKSYLDVVMNNDYKEANIKQVTKSNYNACSYILEDLIKTLTNVKEAGQLCYSFITVTNKGYEQGEYMNGTTRIGYYEKMDEMVDYLMYCDLNETDNLQENYNKYLKDINRDNCTITAQGLDDILFTAIVNLNQSKGTKLTVSHLQSLANILAATRAEMGKIDLQANTYDTVDLSMEKNIINAVHTVALKANDSTMEY